MPGLVFVHGIGGIRHEETDLSRWRMALLVGARRAGHTGWADRMAAGEGPPIRFADYSRLFHSSGGQGGADRLDSAELEILTSLMRESIDARLEGEYDAAVCGRLEQARGQLSPQGQRQGVLDPARRLINVATVLLGIGPLRKGGQWLAPKVMVGQLAQVARYLARSERDVAGATLDARIRTRIAEYLADEPDVVVAHSLGTVVTLEALHHDGPTVSRLVTLGSPIALRLAVLPRLRPSPARTPDRVGEWLNFWDRDDIVCARPILEDAVLANAAGVCVVSARVDSDGVWVHTATKYLEQPAVAGPIVEQLLSGSAG